MYLSPQKINHISRFVELPEMGPSSKFPPLLVVNVQVRTRLSNYIFRKMLWVYFFFILIEAYILCMFGRFLSTRLHFFKMKTMVKGLTLSCTSSSLKVTPKNSHPFSLKTLE